MRLETCIKPRKDGVVNVAIDGATYVFKPDESGVLVADIENKGHLAYLLQNCGDNFMPADPDDFVAADAIAANETDDTDEDGEDGDDGDEEQSQDAAPIEEPASEVAASPLPRGAKKRGGK